MSSIGTFFRNLAGGLISAPIPTPGSRAEQGPVRTATAKPLPVLLPARTRGAKPIPESVARQATEAGIPLVERPALSEVDAGFAVDHVRTFASVLNQGINTYYTRFDESLRSGYENSIAMRNDAMVYELLRHRMYPILSVRHHVVGDTPGDREQERFCAQMTRILDATPSIEDLRLSCLEAIFYGKAGAKTAYAKTMIGGSSRVVVADHQPIHGDKIVHAFDGTPGLMIHQNAVQGLTAEGANTFLSDRATCLKLDKPFYRDRFILHKHEPSDTEFLFEADKAGAVHGLGIRDRIYWVWWLRQEVLAWCMNAMQRIGANGNFIGYYDLSNPASKIAVEAALKTFSEHGVTLFPRTPGSGAGDSMFDHIPPSPIAYDVMMSLVEYYDGIIRRAIVGQELTGIASNTGMGSNQSEVQEGVLQGINAYDARKLAGTLTRDWLRPLIRLNFGEVPFRLKLVFEVEQDGFDKKVDIATKLTSLGAKLDLSDLIAEGGFKPAVDGMQTTVAPPSGGGGGSPGAGPKPPATPPADPPARMSRYAASHAPEGGATIGGTSYEGGEWIPTGTPAVGLRVAVPGKADRQALKEIKRKRKAKSPLSDEERTTLADHSAYEANFVDRGWERGDQGGHINLFYHPEIDDHIALSDGDLAASKTKRRWITSGKIIPVRRFNTAGVEVPLDPKAILEGKPGPGASINDQRKIVSLDQLRSEAEAASGVPRARFGTAEPEEVRPTHRD